MEFSSEQWLRMGHLRYEKCEFKEAKIAYVTALETAKKEEDPRAQGEALFGLLRIAGEAMDKAAIQYWDAEIDKLLVQSPENVSPLIWYGRGAVAVYEGNQSFAFKYLLKFLKLARRKKNQDLKYYHYSRARGFAVLIRLLIQEGKYQRAKKVLEAVLQKYEAEKFRTINGVLYISMGTCAQKEENYELAYQWLQKAHASFLEEHNWYHHLYVLYGYAEVHRKLNKLTQASWYLDLIEKAASGEEFTVLLQQVAIERKNIEDLAVDLLIDARHGFVKSKDLGEISIRKQYVLLDILKVLSESQDKTAHALDRGVSKAEIIKKVWKENYRPEAHDNKLYYNINRLRKLLEPDAAKPKYLLNWKEGYRFAPGLRVQYVDGENDFSVRKNTTDGNGTGEVRK